MLKIFKNQDTLIEEIHNEFDSSQDILLEEAKSIINSTDEKIIDKATRLQKLGFINNPFLELKEMIFNIKKQADLIEYYKKTYPFQKFLTVSELDRICNKYNLIYAPVSGYKKNVPEKNLREIENVSPLKKTDHPSDVVYCLLHKNGSFKLGGGGSLWMSVYSRHWYRVPKKIDNRHFKNQFKASKFVRSKYGIPYKYIIGRVENVTEVRQGLFIAAPKSHFNLEGLKKNGIGLFNFRISEPKDPIVFRYCRGGLQVITKWGKEGEDEVFLKKF